MQSKFNNISKEKSTSLSKHKIFIPTSVNDGKHMLNAFTATCAKLFGDESMGVRELQKMPDYVNENEHSFEE